jgi:hypothetical protein
MTMIKFDKGEKKNVWIEISERDDASFTISSATFEVLDTDGNSVQASGDATISSTRIYGLVDTSTDDFSDGESYEVKFTYVIGSETYIDKVAIKLEETRL